MLGQTYLVTGSDNCFEGLGLARATIFGHDGSRSPIIGTPVRPPRERHSGCCGAAHACQMSSVTSVAQELASWTSWGSPLIDHAGDAFKRKPRQCKDAELVASCGLKGTHGCGSRAASRVPRGSSTAWVVFCAHYHDSQAWSSPAPREATGELSGLCSSDQRMVIMVTAVCKRSLRLAHFMRDAQRASLRLCSGDEEQRARAAPLDKAKKAKSGSTGASPYWNCRFRSLGRFVVQAVHNARDPFWGVGMD